MDFSLFDEAARDYDAEAAELRTAMVRTAVQTEIFPFLAMAATPAEYVHRKALAAERLVSIAQRCDASPQEVEGAADRMYTLLSGARQRTAQLQREAAAECANCGHKGTDHTEGLRCQCGCTDYTPKTDGGTTASRRTAAGEGSGPFS
jgi:hypothetical protein